MEFRCSDELFALQRNVAWLCGLASPPRNYRVDMSYYLVFASPCMWVGWLGKVQSSSNNSNRLLAKNGFAALMPRVHVHRRSSFRFTPVPARHPCGIRSRDFPTRRCGSYSDLVARSQLSSYEKCTPRFDMPIGHRRIAAQAVKPATPITPGIPQSLRKVDSAGSRRE